MKPLKWAGIGLREKHIAELITRSRYVSLLEVHSENYFYPTPAREQLKILSETYSISLHGVGLSLGSVDGLDLFYLKKLKALVKEINPHCVSDHLSWSALEKQYFHDLLPLPYTEESLQLVGNHINQVQDYLGRALLIENISSYISFNESEFSENEFIRELISATQCHLLLDVNNVYVSSVNLHFDPLAYITSLPRDAIKEIHLAGFNRTEHNGPNVLIDSHGNFVASEVWELFRKSIAHLGPKTTVVEWDTNLPDLEILYLEATRAEMIIVESKAC